MRAKDIKRLDGIYNGCKVKVIRLTAYGIYKCRNNHVHMLADNSLLPSEEINTWGGKQKYTNFLRFIEK